MDNLCSYNGNKVTFKMHQRSLAWVNVACICQTTDTSKKKTSGLPQHLRNLQIAKLYSVLFD